MIRASVLFLIGSSAVFAQGPQGDLFGRMQVIADSLGVTCTYCHTADRGSGKPEPTKDIARAMIAMTRDINMKIEAAAGQPGAQLVRVECVTCHRGVPIPKQLVDIIGQTLKDQGAAAAILQYKDLHNRFYGTAAYDFSDATMINIARPISTSRPDDAIALLNTQLEYNPKSSRTLAAIAYAYTRKLDDATAITYLEKALEIEPENGSIQGQLEQLKSYRRKR
jgi:tetratricopeptide (TPR) repeat protein